jgi:hypothetical protein
LTFLTLISIFDKDELEFSFFDNSDENLNSSPCIIFVHGFKGFKDWGFVPYRCEYFAENGFFVVSFNFSHNGVGERFTEFTELEKFAENTFSPEITELSEIIMPIQIISLEKVIIKKSKNWGTAGEELFHC